MVKETNNILKEILRELSIVIFTTNFFDARRPNFLERQLILWENCKAEIIVLDTSIHKVTWLTSKAARLKNTKYIYAPGASLATQLASARGLITRPYVVFFTDDDIYLPSALIEALSLLQQSPSTSTCTYNGCKLIVYGRDKSKYGILWASSFMENQRTLPRSNISENRQRFDFLAQSTPLRTWEAVKTWNTIDLFLQFCQEFVTLTGGKSYVEDARLGLSLNNHLEQVFDALSIFTGNLGSVSSNGILHWSFTLCEFPPTWANDHYSYDNNEYLKLSEISIMALKKVGLDSSTCALIQNRLSNYAAILAQTSCQQATQKRSMFSHLRNSVRERRAVHDTYLRLRAGVPLNAYLMTRRNVAPNRVDLSSAMNFLASDLNYDLVRGSSSLSLQP